MASYMTDRDREVWSTRAVALPPMTTTPAFSVLWGTLPTAIHKPAEQPSEAPKPLKEDDRGATP